LADLYPPVLGFFSSHQPLPDNGLTQIIHTAATLPSAGLLLNK